MIGVAVFDGGANGFRERNRRIEVEAVHRGSAARALFALHWRSVQPMRKAALPEIPRTEKIILRAGADDGRARFAVDEKHVVAFAPPAVLVLQHGHGDTNEMASAGRGKPKVIAFAGQVLFVLNRRITVGFPSVGPARVGLGLAELCVEIERVSRKGFRVGTIVEIVVERWSVLLALVGNRDTRVLLEWHGEKRIQRAFVCNGKKFGFPYVVVPKT